MFKLEFKADNAVFQEVVKGLEVQRILLVIAKMVEEGNDHGNTTLWYSEKGKLTEVWAIV